MSTDVSTDAKKVTDTFNGQYAPKPVSKLKNYGFAIAAIIGIGGLAVGGVGAAGYFGAISNLNQVHAIIMMATGSGGGTILFIVGVVGTVKKCKTGGSSSIPASRYRYNNYTPPRPLRGKRGLEGSEGSQTDFIKKTHGGALRNLRHFGKSEWETYFGDVGEEPPLPDNIDEILNSVCPFSGDESVKVKDTHMLVLVPKTVNAMPLNLNTLEKLMLSPRIGDYITQYRYPSTSTCTKDNLIIEQSIKENHFTTPVQRTYWVLMTRDLIPKSKNKDYDDQKTLVQQHENYRLPRALEVVICLVTEHVISGFKLLDNSATRCSETVRPQYHRNTDYPQYHRNTDYPLYIGGFNGGAGILVRARDPDHCSCLGVVALQRFCTPNL